MTIIMKGQEMEGIQGRGRIKEIGRMFLLDYIDGIDDGSDSEEKTHSPKHTGHHVDLILFSDAFL